MEAVCRICMDNSVALVDIFEKRPTRGAHEEPSLADMLNECAGCQVREDDRLPKQICDTCVLDCLNAFRFKRTSEQSQERFMELLNEQSERESEQREVKRKGEQQASCKLKQEEEEEEEEQEGEWQLTESSMDLGNVKIEKSVFVSCGEEIIPDTKSLQPVDTDHAVQQKKQKPLTTKASHNGIVTLNKSITLNTTAGRIIPIDNASPLTGKIYRCTICGKEFLQLDKLERHQLLHNSDFHPFNCGICMKTFVKRSFLNSHMHSHVKKSNRPHKCPYCPKTFSRQLHVQEHLYSHTGKYPYKCEKCHKQFRSRQGFRNHVCLAAHNELKMAHLSLFPKNS